MIVVTARYMFNSDAAAQAFMHTLDTTVWGETSSEVYTEGSND